MLEWLSQNIFSIIILLVTALLIALLAIKVIKGFKAAASSENPQCFGCPSAKRCAGSCRCNDKKNEMNKKHQ